MRRTAAATAVVAALPVALAAPAVAAPPAPEAGAGSATGDHRATRQATQDVVAAGVPGVTTMAEDRRGTWSATAGVGDLRTGQERSPHDHYRIGTSVPGTRSFPPRPSSRAYSKLTSDVTGPTYDVTHFNPSRSFGAGETIPNSEDLNRFHRALLTGRLLPQKQLDEMTTTVPVGPGRDYGLGLMKATLSCGVTVWGHSGNTPGSRTAAVTTRGGRHFLAFNFDGDRSNDGGAVIEAEFCG